MTRQLRPGTRLPDVMLGRICDGSHSPMALRSLAEKRRIIIVGFPGAFTPVCSRTHIPRFVEMAPSLLRSGVDLIACISANDPWTLEAWAQQIDSSRVLQFYSDGNLEYGRATNLVTRVPEWDLGDCLKRFVLIADNGVVEKINVAV